jgi:hypothetical protein
MKLPARLSSGFSGDWSDWRRRDKKDAIVILGILALTYVVGTTYDWAIKLCRFAVDHENWYIDDLLFMAFVLGLAMIVYGFRRSPCTAPLAIARAAVLLDFFALGEDNLVVFNLVSHHLKFVAQPKEGYPYSRIGAVTSKAAASVGLLSEIGLVHHHLPHSSRGNLPAPLSWRSQFAAEPASSYTVRRTFDPAAIVKQS